MKYPDFIIIGCMKCGTTALYHNLKQHPGIWMARNPRDPKAAGVEIRFWNNKPPTRCYRFGHDWYRGLFASDYVGGEKCANYIESPKAMKLMYDFIPDVKLIICVRNPTDRLYSEFRMRKPEEKQTPRLYKFARRTGARMRGSYMAQIERSVLSAGFKKEQIKIVAQEIMKDELQEGLDDIYTWLGLESHCADIRTLPFQERDTKTIRAYRTWESSYPPIPADIQAELIKYYKQRNEQLFEFMGYRIPEWQYP